MTKSLIALACAACFGLANAADAQPGGDKQGTPDAAIGNTPQTTAPVGTNAPAKHKKASSKKSRRHHGKAKATSDGQTMGSGTTGQ